MGLTLGLSNEALNERLSKPLEAIKSKRHRIKAQTQANPHPARPHCSRTTPERATFHPFCLFFSLTLLVSPSARPDCLLFEQKFVVVDQNAR